MSLDKGLIHVYTGDGKGKTTAALGQALRSSGRALTVLVHQFFKLASEPSGEQMTELKGVEYRRGDFRHPFFDKNADRAAISGKIRAALKAITWEHDVVILDEINNALRDGFVTWQEFEAFIDSKPAHIELICTGRGAPEALIARADYVTELKKIKHPMEKSQAARMGIEF